MVTEHFKINGKRVPEIPLEVCTRESQVLASMWQIVLTSIPGF